MSTEEKIENKKEDLIKSEEAPLQKQETKKKRQKREVSHAHAYIHCSFNNTIVTITDEMGNVICWSSAGKRGFKGARKSTPFAAQLAAEDAIKLASDHGVKTLSVFVDGPGAGRETALRGLQSSNVRITLLRDITPVPHNGCRPPKRRRV